MKKSILIIIVLSFAVQLNGQELFTVPVKTLEQKHNRMLYMNWINIVPAIKFAKTQGVSPYEYGQFVGSLYGRKRKDYSFKGYAQSFLRNWEYHRPDSEPAIVIELESDSMLVFKVPSSILVKYGFDEDGLIGVSIDEMLDMMNGSHSQISKKMGCSSKMELKDEWIIITISEIE
ncbi:MAG: hypothetical protein H8E14_17945 [Candidatus Marinimicrobia bacterium]|nr:hypothetical protein [Candidatus Neomarinimicrobiota bacterium]